MPIFTGRATGAFGGTISFEWYPDPDVVAMELIETSENLEDRSVPLALSRVVAQQEHMDHFESQSDPEGTPWRPWSASYAPIAAATNVGQILQRYMDLEYAVVSPEAYPVTLDSVFFSTAGLPEYWLWNQEGTGSFQNWGFIDTRTEEIRSRGLKVYMPGGINWGIGKGQALPARPFVGMSVEAQLKILEIFDMWFDSAVTSVFQRGTKLVVAQRAAGGQFTGRSVVI